MRETIKLEIPTSWEDVTLEKYLTLINDMENYRDDEEAQVALMLTHLCGVEGQYLKSISKESYDMLKSKLSAFITPEDAPLVKFLEIDGVQYGFEPNLSKMSYGAYADISQYETFTIDKNWAKIMDVLYRPVTKVKGERYTIAPYIGELDESKWFKVGMDVHFGALFFFVRLQLALLQSTLSSLKETELPVSIRPILAKSGKLMQQSLNSLTGISKK